MLQDPIFGPESLRNERKALGVTVFKNKKKAPSDKTYFDLFPTYLFPHEKRNSKHKLHLLLYIQVKLPREGRYTQFQAT